MSRKSSQKKRYRLASLLMALMLIVCVVSSATVSVFATSVNQSVTNVTNSLMQVRMVYKDADGVEVPIQGGTGFLINENTVLTCAHVVDLDAESEDLLKQLYGNKYNKNNLSLQVVVSGDVTIPATLKKESRASDFAIINLNETIGNRVPVVLGDSEAVEATQLVYALGFPASVAELQNKNTYTSSDVTITDGKVSKLNSSDGTDYIQHGAILTDGNSGGPLVDESGAVIGINKGSHDDYYYAISINQIKEILDALEIQYQSGVSAPVEDPTTAESDIEEEPTLAPATVAPATESNVIGSLDDVEDEGGIDIVKLVIIIAIVVLVIILVVIIIVVVSGNKKKSAANNMIPPYQTMTNAPSQIPQKPAQAPVPPQPYGGRPQMPNGGNVPTMPSNEGSGETSVLNDGAGETTVLGNQATGFFLVRKSNGERININKPEFVIGKERRRVDYCISDNNSISRTHAKIKVRAGRCYVLDMGSTNCTFVNGSRLNPNQEVILSKGDKIKISDEEFEFLG